MSFFKRREPTPAAVPAEPPKPVRTYYNEFMQMRGVLARERMSRQQLIKFLDTNCVRTENSDGTVTFTITSFVRDLKHLLIEEPKP